MLLKERAKLERELNMLGYEALAGKRTEAGKRRACEIMVLLGRWTTAEAKEQATC